MEGYLRRRPEQRSAFNFLYAENFLFSFHLFLILYIVSTFLAGYVGETYAGAVFAAGSALSFIAFYFISRLLIRIGNFKTVLTLTGLEFFVLIGLALADNVFVVVTLFLLHVSLAFLIHFSLDIFMEEYTSDESSTGSKRGIFLTVQAVAVLLGILASGLILTDGDYWKVFLLSALVLVPFFGIIAFRFGNFTDPNYRRFKLVSLLVCVLQNRNLANILGAQIILRLFFSAVVVYFPIYLHDHIGLSWSQIGVVFAVSLLPYVFFEIPAGKLADKLRKEKELLLAGFIIMIAATAGANFIITASVVWWTLLLGIMRTGASLVEIMTESYFFKHVDGDDSNTITLFRMARPAGYVIGPALGTIFLLFLPLKSIFWGLALVTILGIYFAARIKNINL